MKKWRCAIDELMNWWKTRYCAIWWIDELMKKTRCAIDELMKNLMNWWTYEIVLFDEDEKQRISNSLSCNFVEIVYTRAVAEAPNKRRNSRSGFRGMPVNTIPATKTFRFVGDGRQHGNTSMANTCLQKFIPHSKSHLLSIKIHCRNHDDKQWSQEKHVANSCC